MLDYSSLMKEIKNINGCYFIYSYDYKLVNNFLKELEKKYINKEFKELNYVSLKFDNNFNVDNFFELSDTIPVLQEKKIIVLENALFLKRGFENKEILDKLKKYFENPPTHSIIISYYIFQDIDKNKDLLNDFSKFGQVCKILEFKGNEFYNAVAKIFKRHEVKISNALINYFCDRVGNDFSYIESEILKLKFYLDGEELTQDVIKQVVSRNLEHNVFIFINSVFDKNLKMSLINLREVTNSGVNLNYIFSMLSSQFSKFLDVKIMLESGKDTKEIMSKININKYVLNNFVKLSYKYKLNEVVDILDRFLDIEYKFRSIGNLDIVQELERFVVYICSK